MNEKMWQQNAEQPEEQIHTLNETEIVPSLLDDPEILELMEIVDPHESLRKDNADAVAKARIEIAGLQFEKENVLARAEELLTAIEAGEEAVWDKASRNLGVTERDDEIERYAYAKKKGEPIPLTKGGMLAAQQWGTTYRLPPTLPVEERREYVHALARTKLAELHDRQIAHAEVTATYHEGRGYYEVYAKVLEKDHNLDRGLLAEKMVKGFFIALTHDHELPFTIKDVDLRTDVEKKIDFKVILNNPLLLRNRGVKVNSASVPNEIGVQFTTTRSDAVLAKKEKQISTARKELKREQDPVKDIVIVDIAIEKIEQWYKEWKDVDGRANGGPEAFWNDELRELVFKEVVEKIPAYMDPDALWEQVQGTHLKAAA